VLERTPLKMRRRTFLALMGLLTFDALLLGRVIYVQGVWAKRLRRLAEDAHLRGVPLAPLRGKILAQDGRVLAESYHVFSAYAVPVQVQDVSEEAAVLSAILGLPVDRVARRLRRRLGFVWLKRRLTETQVAALKAQAPALPGVFLVPETTRWYPEGALAGQVVGFTGVDNQGLAGLEYTYKKVLTGRRGWVLREFDAAGRPVPGAASHLDPPVAGNSLRTTLDLNIQAMADQAAEDAYRRHGAKRVMILVMEPDTGGILALADHPGFNPNYYRDYTPQASRDQVISDAIPPGSIFKPVTLAAALQSRAIGLGAGFFCPGFKIVSGRRVNCWRRAGHGPEDLTAAVRNSCNVAFMQMGLAIGKDRFYDYLGRFRVLGPTGVDLPGEAHGITPPKGRATPLDLAVMAFGQTLTVTPVALLNAVSALANGGMLRVPHVGQAILSPTGVPVRELFVNSGYRVVDPWVAQAAQRMMAAVVTQGSGKLAQVPGYRIAGKTGTAQKVIGGRVVEGVYIASFVAFGPLPKPRVSVLCSVDEPQGAYYGGQVAAPVVGRLLKQIFRYYGLPPTQRVKPPRPGEPAMVPNLVNLDPEDARQDALAFGFAVAFVGRGPVVVDQSVSYGAYLPAGETLTLTLGQAPRIYMDWVAVPNLVGLRVGDARQVAFDIGINLHVEGNPGGRVQWQEWPENQEVRAGVTMTVGAQ
jgi:stage V sporulation protein D (sporulation-specific penicillin-binding protein)